MKKPKEQILVFSARIGGEWIVVLTKIHRGDGAYDFAKKRASKIAEALDCEARWIMKDITELTRETP